jgi:hypothetical protein
MKLNIIKKPEFIELAYNNTAQFLERINAPEVFVVKEFYPRNLIIELRNKMFDWGLKSEPSWHPLLDDCPDYHRLHDNYPGAYVKQKFHAFYKHGWYPANQGLFDTFREIYDLKNYLGGFEKNSFLSNKPSQHVVARLNVHHYPKGGGYQAEHIDPKGAFAVVQTLIAASQHGQDYKEGGVFGREKQGGELHYLDQYTEIGDLLIISPGIPHGVSPIDPQENYSWKTNDGRWMILPIFLHSDYPNPETVKPKQI